MLRRRRLPSDAVWRMGARPGTPCCVNELAIWESITRLITLQADALPARLGAKVNRGRVRSLGPQRSHGASAAAEAALRAVIVPPRRTRSMQNIDVNDTCGKL